MKITPKNVENVPAEEPYCFILKVPDERSLFFVPPVSYFGHTLTTANIGSYIYQRKELEFCFRLSSDEKFAEDEIDHKVYRNQFPHLLIKRPETLHRYRADIPRRAFFIIYPAESMELFELADIDLTQPGYEFQITPEITSLMDEIRQCETLIHTPGIPERIDLLAIRLISAVILQKKKQQHNSPHHNLIREIASYLDCHLNEEIDFRKLAETRGISLRNFFRRWKEVFRESPAQYLLLRRMELAKRLLGRSNMDVGMVAERTGFSSTGYFIQAFKHHCGITPAAYRRQLRQA